MMTSDTLTGRMMGGYQLSRRLGRGGMASVYLAYDKKLQREVAIKVLLGVDASDEQFSARFQQEALATARLDHPNIIHMYDYGREGDLVYMVMEYCPNGSLLDMLSKLSQQGQFLDADYTVQIISQIALALDFAHQRGIIHRDIKPSNILFASDGRPVLADLGIAKALAGPRLTHTRATIGTPEYMSPEQARGGTVDARSDVYSLGVVLYEMLAGQPPFHADTPWGLIYQHVSEPLPPLRQRNPKVTPALASVVERAMVKDPASRFQSGREMAEALRLAQQKPGRALYATPVPTPRLTPAPTERGESPTMLYAPVPNVVVPPSRPPRKGTAGLVALAVVAIAAAGILLIAFTSRPPQPSPAAAVTLFTQENARVDPTQTASTLQSEVAATLSAVSQSTETATISSSALETPSPAVTVVERVIEKVVTATATERKNTPASTSNVQSTATSRLSAPSPTATSRADEATPTAVAPGVQLAAPVLTGPDDHWSDPVGTVAFSWNPVAGATGYVVETRSDRPGQTDWFTWQAVGSSASSFLLSYDANTRYFQIPGTVYYWRAVPLGPGGRRGQPSNERVFVFQRVVDTPEPRPTDTPEPWPTDTPEPWPTDTPEPWPTDTPEPWPTDTPEPTPPVSRGILSETTQEASEASSNGLMLGTGLFFVFMVAVQVTDNRKGRGKR